MLPIAICSTIYSLIISIFKQETIFT
jgi:hypothetical protein